MQLILTPEVYLAGFMSPGGPPAELFTEVLTDKHELMLCSQLRDALEQLMVENGYSLEKSKAEVAFIVGLNNTTMLDVPADSTQPLVDLAKQAQLETVYFSGGKYQDADGVHFAPVQELMSLLEFMRE